jgi:manganese transport protein
MQHPDDHSLSEVHHSVDTTAPRQNRWRRLFSFLGPAYLVSVGYMDPGNWATDLQGGSRFGYSLIWVLLMSNLMAILLQSLSARLGIVRGKDLAQANREAYPKYVNFILYGLAELAIAACDLAEVLGMAIGIQLLFDIPLTWGVMITVADTFLLLYLQRLGIRKMEAFIIGLVAVVAFSFLIEILFARPAIGEVASGFIPYLENDAALYIAIGIIGATVMPHNLYLHSALVQTRKIDRTDSAIRRAIRFNLIDSTIALNIAFLVNLAILVLAATVFFKTGNSQVGEIREAHRLLEPLLGNTLAPKLFAIALIAAGQSSTITGTLAGQIVMEGYLRLRINPLLRRLITRLLAIVPALLVIILYGEEEVDDLLVFSQVLLSLQLGFAIIPLIHFVSDKKKMGNFVIGKWTRICAWLIAAVLIALNGKMLMNETLPLLQSGSLMVKSLILFCFLFFGSVLAYIIIHPLLGIQEKADPVTIHPEIAPFGPFIKAHYRAIAIALDFSANDEKLISAALGLGHAGTTYHLIHVVESASAALLNHESDDYETRQDARRMDYYVEQLLTQGVSAKGYLGYKSRTVEITRIVLEVKADLLVAGAHRHTGLRDFIHGETINTVRHQLNLPVFIVNV